MNPESNFDCIQLCQNLNKLRIGKENCDVTIQIGDKTFFAHRNVLTAQMEFFARMFTGDTEENKSGIVNFEPEIVSPDVFDEILNFVYTSQLELTPQKVSKICVATKFFCYGKLFEKIQEYLLSILEAENVLDCLELGKKFGFRKILEKCLKVVYEDFLIDIIKSEIIPYWSYEDLLKALKIFNIEHQSDRRFQLIVEWIKLDEIGRKSKFSELLSLNISFTFLSKEFSERICSEQNIWFKKEEFLEQLRKTYSKQENIYLFGGYNDFPKVFFSSMKFSSSTEKWLEMPTFHQMRQFVSCAAVKDKIYLCGGKSESTKLDTLEVFDTKTQLFRTLKPMKYAKYSCAVAALDNFIYVAGGYCGSKDLTSSLVERYNIETNEWEKVASMFTRRSNFALVELNKKLYALGGADYIVECYDPKTNRWGFIPRMRYATGEVTAVNFHNKIYVVEKQNFEAYDPKTNSWTVMPSLKDPIEGSCLVVFQNRLTVIGGRIFDPDSQTMKCVSIVKCFDFTKNAWVVAENMRIQRQGHCGIAIVEEPSPDFN